MPVASPASTAFKILASAEELFAQFGYSSVSLRQITVAAGVNLAAVNYHYYDKESLYREILQRRLQQINRRRLTLLAEAETRAGGGPVPLAAIIDALARPLLVPDTETGAAGARLLGRLLSERQPFTATLLTTEFQPVMTRFGQVIRRHDPALPASNFVWRLSFVIGALHHALVTMPDMSAHTSGLCRPDDCAGALENFTDFAVKALSP